MCRQQDDSDNNGASTIKTTMADKGNNNDVTKAMMAFVGNKGDNDCEDGR